MSISLQNNRDVDQGVLHHLSEFGDNRYPQAQTDFEWKHKKANDSSSMETFCKPKESHHEINSGPFVEAVGCLRRHGLRTGQVDGKFHEEFYIWGFATGQ